MFYNPTNARASLSQGEGKSNQCQNVTADMFKSLTRNIATSILKIGQKQPKLKKS